MTQKAEVAKGSSNPGRTNTSSREAEGAAGGVGTAVNSTAAEAEHSMSVAALAEGMARQDRGGRTSVIGKLKIFPGGAQSSSLGRGSTGRESMMRAAAVSKGAEAAGPWDDMMAGKMSGLLDSLTGGSCFRSIS